MTFNMDLSSSVENANVDLEHFIKEANAEEFAKRFPAWFGPRENFSYNIYKKGLCEKKYQARMKGEPDPLTARDCRRAYKIGIAKIRIELDKEEGAKTDSEQKNMMSCLRCMLIKSGSAFINKNTIYSSCTSFSPNFKEFTEEDLKLQPLAEVDAQHLIDNDEVDYPATLAISTALGAIEVELPIGRNYPPAQIIKERLLDCPLIFQNGDGHQCEAPFPQLEQDFTLDLQLQVTPASDGYRITEHVMIYAPPGFGKTTLQHQLLKRGVAILDTDDAPQTTKERLDKMLNVSSVLTNKLDLVKSSTRATIFFVPDSPQVLSLRNPSFQLSEADAQYWYQKHEEIEPRPNLLKCRVRNTYITQWFSIPSTTLNLRPLANAVEPIVMRVDYASMAHTVRHSELQLDINQVES